MGMFQQAGNSFDVTGICLGIVGLVLLTGYIAFAALVTHRGNFYQARRWKGAILISSIPMVPVLGVLAYLFIVPNWRAWSSEGVVQIAGHIVQTVMAALALIAPVLFPATWKTWDRLRWSVQAEDFLDKIWKDPNKGHRSPFQEI